MFVFGGILVTLWKNLRNFMFPNIY